MGKVTKSKIIADPTAHIHIYNSVTGEQLVFDKDYEFSRNEKGNISGFIITNPEIKAVKVHYLVPNRIINYKVSNGVIREWNLNLKHDPLAAYM